MGDRNTEVRWQKVAKPLKTKNEQEMIVDIGFAGEGGGHRNCVGQKRRTEGTYMVLFTW